MGLLIVEYNETNTSFFADPFSQDLDFTIRDASVFWPIGIVLCNGAISLVGCWPIEIVLANKAFSLDVEKNIVNYSH
jgi:hypothetical protein